MERYSRRIAVVSLIIGFLIFVYSIPLFGGNYTNYISAKIWILSLYGVAFNVMFGYCGLLSFGHAVFFSISAYTTGILLVKLNCPIALALLLGLVSAVVTAAIVGFLSLRHREIHFAMITLALSMLFWGIVMKWRSLTGGEDGLTGIVRGISLKYYYYITVTVVLMCLYMIQRILTSDFGLLLKGIRENEIRVEFSGHSVVKLRMVAMLISGLFTGVAGILWTFLDCTVTPSIAHWSFSAIPVIAALIGGPQTFVGPVVGTTVYVLAEDFVTRYTLYWQIWLGLVIIFIVLFFRGGIVGSIVSRYLNKYLEKTQFE